MLMLSERAVEIAVENEREITLLFFFFLVLQMCLINIFVGTL